MFLWPRPCPLRLQHLIGGHLTTSIVEQRLQDYFPQAQAVLFSSARAALSAILESLGLGRPDLVYCPPFSSHCVFETIARIATPTTESSAPRAALIYHQWGHIARPFFPEETLLIEDAVDTLLAPGDDPFAIDGLFTLWSLPKTIASQWGGVAFCRTEKDAVSLRRIRDNRPSHGLSQAWLRLLGERFPTAHAYWHGLESAGGHLPSFALRQILDCLEVLPDLAKKRGENLALLQPYSLAPASRRLPCCLPLPPEGVPGHSLTSGQALTVGIRNFNIAGRFPNPEWQRVFPAPIHQDVNGTDVAEIVAKLNLLPQFQPQ